MTIYYQGHAVTRAREVTISVDHLLALAMKATRPTDDFVEQLKREWSGPDRIRQVKRAEDSAPPCYMHWKTVIPILQRIKRDGVSEITTKVQEVASLHGGRRLVVLNLYGYPAMTVPEACLEDTTAQSPVRRDVRLRITA